MLLAGNGESYAAGEYPVQCLHYHDDDATTGMRTT